MIIDILNNQSRFQFVSFVVAWPVGMWGIDVDESLEAVVEEDQGEGGHCGGYAAGVDRGLW